MRDRCEVVPNGTVVRCTLELPGDGRCQAEILVFFGGRIDRRAFPIGVPRARIVSNRRPAVLKLHLNARGRRLLRDTGGLRATVSVRLETGDQTFAKSTVVELNGRGRR